MRQPPSASADLNRAGADVAWAIVQEAARLTEGLAGAGQSAAFAFAPEARHGSDGAAGALRRVPEGDSQAVLEWRAADGWHAVIPHSDPRRATIDLYLPICNATERHPMTVGHLGQSLDGFIATHSGDSQYVTGRENILHLHRMRALCDAIIVGAGTVAADDPRLTTRHVTGPNPVRVILDPARRLGDHYKVFSDDAVETLYVCERSLVRPGEARFGQATIVAVDQTSNGIDVAAVIHLLHARGCHRIFVEGGGVTVSMFLEAGLLDRLHVAIAPLLIGNGRPAIRLPAPNAIADCARPNYRVFRMGGDVFFDCDLKSSSREAVDQPAADGPPVIRVI